MLTVPSLITRFQLQPHPEGGWYKENYRSDELVQAASLPERFGGERVFSTAIYFLLERGNFSAFHRIKSDECWHFYAGGPLHIYMISPDGLFSEVVLGADFEKGQLFQYVVPANYWFASRPANETVYSFVGCTVAPGFDFRDFELANRSDLLSMYPSQTAIIVELTRE